MVNVIVMKKNSYGIGFRGSKNRVADEIIEVLPNGKRLCYLFAGGCAITHAATLSGKWEKVLSNDLYPVMGQEVFRQACAGEFNKPEYQRIVGWDEYLRDRYNYGWLATVWSKRRGGIQNSNGYAKNTTHIEHLFIHNRWRE